MEEINHIDEPSTDEASPDETEESSELSEAPASPTSPVSRNTLLEELLAAASSRPGIYSGSDLNDMPWNGGLPFWATERPIDSLGHGEHH